MKRAHSSVDDWNNAVPIAEQLNAILEPHQSVDRFHALAIVLAIEARRHGMRTNGCDTEIREMLRIFQNDFGAALIVMERDEDKARAS